MSTLQSEMYNVKSFIIYIFAIYKTSSTLIISTLGSADLRILLLRVNTCILTKLSSAVLIEETFLEDWLSSPYSQCCKKHLHLIFGYFLDHSKLFAFSGHKVFCFSAKVFVEAFGHESIWKQNFIFLKLLANLHSVYTQNVTRLIRWVFFDRFRIEF